MKKRLVSLIIAAVLLLGVIPRGIFDFAASAEAEAEEDYTDPDHPYIATSFNGLREVFEKERPEGTTIYIKLGRNIEDAVKDRHYADCLHTNDAIYLLRYTLFGESYHVYEDADFNKDGKVTSNDAVYLLRHTLFAGDYPLT